MSNFADRLDELMERATKGPWVPHHGEYPSPLRSSSVKDEDAYVEAEVDRPGLPIIWNSSFIRDEDLDFIVYLVNHAPAIRDLVRAAENICEIYNGMDGFVAETAPEGYQQRIIQQMYRAALAALAKLEEA